MQKSLFASLILLLPASAIGQTAQDAQPDAFGRLVGLESIGLYDENQVRGFDLENAGNYRIEGAYFSRASSPLYLLRAGTTVRIGVNALRYDFPAPSGVVEFDLVRAKPGTRASVEGGNRAYSGPFLDVVGSWGSADGKGGIVAGINAAPAQSYTDGVGGDYWSGGIVARWKPAPTAEISAFATTIRGKTKADTGYLPLGEFLPPRIPRWVAFKQSWTKLQVHRDNAGLFGHVGLGDGWRITGGIFHSAQLFSRADFNLIAIENPQGDFHAVAFVNPDQSVVSRSGSILVERDWASRDLTHHLVATVRARNSVNRSKPSLQFDAGASNLSGPFPRIPEPDFQFGSGEIRDTTRQVTAGLGYRLGIGRRLELRADIQRTTYRKMHREPDGTMTKGQSRPWLYSGSVLYAVTPRLALFASYSRGLEESGVAPNSVINRGEVLPAVLATQREVGVRYGLASSLSLIAGLFDTRKRTAGTGPDGRFDLIGEVRHRGFEASLAGALGPRLNVLAGIMVLDARLSGPLVDANVIGRWAVARPSSIVLMNGSWKVPALEKLSLDGTLTRRGRAYISPANDAQSKVQTTLDLGLRYELKASTVPVTLRLRMLNVFNRFYWQPDVTGTLYPSYPRGLDLSLTADF